MTLEKILKRIDDEMTTIAPGTESFDRLLKQREEVMNLIKKEKEKPEKDKKKLDPNTLATCITSLLQVVGLSVVGFLTRLDRDALHFIKKL